jgi:hypothetical protein
MSAEDEQEPLLTVTANDRAWDRRLREQIGFLRDKSRGTEFADLLDDVLKGRRTLREVARTPAFDEAVRPAVQKMASEWDALTESEKEALAAQAKVRIDEQTEADQR